MGAGVFLKLDFPLLHLSLLPLSQTSGCDFLKEVSIAYNGKEQGHEHGPQRNPEG